MEQYNKQLKSCPHCGGGAYFTTQDIDISTIRLAIECPKCKYHMLGDDITYRIPRECTFEIQKLRDKWNLRAN